MSLLSSLPLQNVTFYGSTLVDNGSTAKGQHLEIPGASRPGLVSKNGLILFGNDGKAVRAHRVMQGEFKVVQSIHND